MGTERVGALSKAAAPATCSFAAHPVASSQEECHTGAQVCEDVGQMRCVHVPGAGGGFLGRHVSRVWGLSCS